LICTYFGILSPFPSLGGPLNRDIRLRGVCPDGPSSSSTG
jgi:hypothetical protein